MDHTRSPKRTAGGRQVPLQTPVGGGRKVTGIFRVLRTPAQACRPFEHPIQSAAFHLGNLEFEIFYLTDSSTLFSQCPVANSSVIVRFVLTK